MVPDKQCILTTALLELYLLGGTNIGGRSSELSIQATTPILVAQKG
jgi:hypothetical protein